MDIYEARPFIGGKVASYVDKNGNHIEVRAWRGRPATAQQQQQQGLTRIHATACAGNLGDRPLHTHDHAAQMGLHVFFGCYHNLFRLMAKCGVLENLLLKEHTHTFCNNDGDVRELDFRFFLGDTKVGAPFHGARQLHGGSWRGWGKGQRWWLSRRQPRSRRMLGPGCGRWAQRGPM